MHSVTPCRRTGMPTRRSCGCGRRGPSSCRRSGAWSSRRSRDGRYGLQGPGDMPPCPWGAEGTGEMGTALIPPCSLPGSCQRAELDESSLRSMEKQVRPGKSLEVTSALQGVLALGMPPGLCQEPKGPYFHVLPCRSRSCRSGWWHGTGRRRSWARRWRLCGAAYPRWRWVWAGHSWQCPGLGTGASPPPCTPRMRRRTRATTLKRCKMRRESRLSSQVGLPASQ